MSEVSGYTWRELVETVPFEGEPVEGMACIEGVIDGVRWGALVPVVVAQDEPAAKAYLLFIAKRTPVTVPSVEVVG